MQLATQVILLCLSGSVLGSGNAFWPDHYEDEIEFPYHIDKPQEREHVNYFDDSAIKKPAYFDAELKYKTTTPITPIHDAESNPNHLMYRRRADQKQPIIAGLDNMRPIDERSCLNDVLEGNSSLSSPVQCARTCRKNDRRICYYNFIVENYQINGLACKLCTPSATNPLCSNCQCILADGTERSAQVVNRQLPGPAIEVCEGDHIVIDVTNRAAGSGLSLHWHGLFQKGFQYYDGVPYITQCPIGDSNTFRYQFGANNAGTHFWHAHSGFQKMDGIFGSLIVRQSPGNDLQSHLYDYDLSTHVLIISDWMHNQAVSHFPGKRFHKIGQLPDSILINGRGLVTDPASNITTNATIEVIDVEPGKRYRIRLINAFCTICPGMLTIQDHKLQMIATDGRDIKPVTVDSVTSFAGERYDFVLNADKPVGSYWIQVRGMGPCALQNIQQIALLRYKASPSPPSLASPTFNEGLYEGVTLNALNATCEVPMDNLLCVSNLDSIEPIDKGILRLEPDLKFYLPVGFYQYTLSEVFQPNEYPKFMVASAKSTIDAIIDGISFKFPPSPPLSQPKDIPDNQYCNRATLPESCNDNLCSCTHKLNIPLNAIVEIVLVDELQATNLTHPFHMHGHAFYVMGMGRAADKNVDSINWKIVREMDKRNLVNRCFDKPVKKDTIVIPYNGYVVIRFRADNPGYWLFHCHFIYHQISGMEIVLQVGNQEDVPPVPHNFPKCGQYSPTIGYNAYPSFSTDLHKLKRPNQKHY